MIFKKNSVKKNSSLQISNIVINPGERINIALPTPEVYTCTPMHIPIHVIHGKFQGPCLLICAAFHGDEINGIEIIQRLLKLNIFKSFYGTLIAIPVVNVYGLMSRSRNLLDQRDLAGSFPGSKTGTFASRLAYSLNKGILNLATHFIDIHSGEPHYTKFPQIQTSFEHKEALEMAKIFQPSVIVQINAQKGLAFKMLNDNKPVLVYDAGEALRIDEYAIKIGINGIIRVMKYLGMLKTPMKHRKSIIPLNVKSTIWIRSPGSGLYKLQKKLGSYVQKNELLASIKDPFGTRQKHNVISPANGIIIGNNTFPLINEGDPILEIASLETKITQDLPQQGIE